MSGPPRLCSFPSPPCAQDLQRWRAAPGGEEAVQHLRAARATRRARRTTGSTSSSLTSFYPPKSRRRNAGALGGDAALKNEPCALMPPGLLSATRSAQDANFELDSRVGSLCGARSASRNTQPPPLPSLASLTASPAVSLAGPSPPVLEGTLPSSSPSSGRAPRLGRAPSTPLAARGPSRGTGRGGRRRSRRRGRCSATPWWQVPLLCRRHAQRPCETGARTLEEHRSRSDLT